MYRDHNRYHRCSPWNLLCALSLALIYLRLLTTMNQSRRFPVFPGADFDDAWNATRLFGSHVRDCLFGLERRQISSRFHFRADRGATANGINALGPPRTCAHNHPSGPGRRESPVKSTGWNQRGSFSSSDTYLRSIVSLVFQVVVYTDTYRGTLAIICLVVHEFSKPPCPPRKVCSDTKGTATNAPRQASRHSV